jgi:hypothetical protein
MSEVVRMRSRIEDRGLGIDSSARRGGRALPFFSENFPQDAERCTQDACDPPALPHSEEGALCRELCRKLCRTSSDWNCQQGSRQGPWKTQILISGILIRLPEIPDAAWGARRMVWHVFRANGPASCQPSPTGWVSPQTEVSRAEGPIQNAAFGPIAGLGRAFSPECPTRQATQADGLGWHRMGRWPARNPASPE